MSITVTVVVVGQSEATTLQQLARSPSLVRCGPNRHILPLPIHPILSPASYHPHIHTHPSISSLVIPPGVDLNNRVSLLISFIIEIYLIPQQTQKVARKGNDPWPISPNSKKKNKKLSLLPGRYTLGHTTISLYPTPSVTGNKKNQRFIMAEEQHPGAHVLGDSTIQAPSVKKHRVKVRNLDYGCTEEELTSLFKNHCTVWVAHSLDLFP